MYVLFSEIYEFKYIKFTHLKWTVHIYSFAWCQGLARVLSQGGSSLGMTPPHKPVCSYMLYKLA